MPRASSSGIAIEYDEAGHGEPALLCLPGWCASRHAFDALVARAATKRRVLALDWRGHGGSGPAAGDFAFDALVEDACAVIEASGARVVVPVATAHAGWVAIELRRRLHDRIPRLVLVDWIVTPAPPPFLAGLAALQDAQQYAQARERLFGMWLEGVEHDEVVRFVREDMAKYGFEMWSRAGREIAGAYARHGSPLAALSALDPPPPTLHLYAQPADPGTLQAQRAFAADHPWFHVERLDARSHFPTLEVPDQMVEPIERFARG